MTVNKQFELMLDIKHTYSHRDFTVINGDNGNRIRVYVMDGSDPVALTGCRVLAAFARADGVTAIQDSGRADGGVSIGGAAANSVDIELYPASFSPGIVEAELQIYSDDTLASLITTARFNFKCRQAIVNEDSLMSGPEYPPLREMSDRLEGLMAEVSDAERRRGELMAKLAGMTVSADTLKAGEPATASMSERENAMHISLGLPAGEKGEKGDKGDAGNVMFATFDLSAETGLLTVTTPNGYSGPQFRLNDEGYMEVMINEQS